MCWEYLGERKSWRVIDRRVCCSWGLGFYVFGWKDMREELRYVFLYIKYQIDSKNEIKGGFCMFLRKDFSQWFSLWGFFSYGDFFS